MTIREYFAMCGHAVPAHRTKHLVRMAAESKELQMMIVGGETLRDTVIYTVV